MRVTIEHADIALAKPPGTRLTCDLSAMRSTFRMSRRDYNRWRKALHERKLKSLHLYYRPPAPEPTSAIGHSRAPLGDNK